MPEQLLSLGLDVGTTSTQMIFSRLTIENKAGAFSVPEMEIQQREILYRSPVHFTPLLREELVDAAALRKIVDGAYAEAGLRKEQVATGAIIITGETSRRENARAVLEELSGYAGDFVVATAGPALESVLAAKGAGAVAWSEKTGKPVLHMDIGGGTSNLAWIREGKIRQTGCMNVGGRLLKFGKDGRITYISPVLEGLTQLKIGEKPTQEAVRTLADVLVQGLEMAAGLRPATELLERLWTREMPFPQEILRGEWVFSFSGGVADCIETRHPWQMFGDMGPVLGQAIGESGLCWGEYRLGEETIRATVIGAGCHSAQLSGSTVFHRNLRFPLKNLPVVRTEQPESGEIRRLLAQQEGLAVLALPGSGGMDYASVRAYGKAIAEGCGDRPVLVCLERDMAKALGQVLALLLPKDRPILCIDRVKLGPESYLDVAAPVGPAIPVVMKTLILER